MKLIIDIAEELKTKIKVECARNNLTLKSFLLGLIKNYFAEKEEKNDGN